MVGGIVGLAEPSAASQLTPAEEDRSNCDETFCMAECIPQPGWQGHSGATVTKITASGDQDHPALKGDEYLTPSQSLTLLAFTEEAVPT